MSVAHDHGWSCAWEFRSRIEIKNSSSAINGEVYVVVFRINLPWRALLLRRVCSGHGVCRCWIACTIKLACHYAFLFRLEAEGFAGKKIKATVARLGVCPNMHAKRKKAMQKKR